jgi:HEAT repeat protein
MRLLPAVLALLPALQLQGWGIAAAAASAAAAPRALQGPGAGPAAEVDLRDLLRQVKLERDKADVKLYGQMASAASPAALKTLQQAIGELSEQRTLNAAYGAVARFKGTPLDEKARGFLVGDVLRHRREENRTAACAALTRWGVAAADELERVVAKAEDRPLRTRAVHALLPLYAERGDLDSAEEILEYGAPGGNTLAGIRKALLPVRGSKALKLYHRALKDEERDAAWRYLLLDVLASWKDEGADAVILDLLDDPDPVLVSAALEVLGNSGRSHLVRRLEPFLRGEHPLVLREALIAVTRLTQGDPYWLEDVLDFSRRREPATRMGAAVALAEIRTEPALARLYELLDDEDWRVRVEVVGQLTRLHRKEIVPLLIERLDRASARLGRDMHLALRLLTGQDHGPRSARWRAWWQAEGEAFRLPGPKDAQKAEAERQKRRAENSTQASFYGLEVVSQRVAFLIDRSGSMQGRAMLQPEDRTEKPRASTRWEVAKHQLMTVLPKLSEETLLNILFFGSDIRPWQDELVQLVPKVRDQAIEHVRKFPMGGSTNIYDALELAFADERVDTIYLLTDGEPSSGKVVDPTEIRSRIGRLNRTRKVVIHTVSVGRKSRFLRLLAEENGGLYTEAL